jgi:RHS repeat-associated protein
MGGSFARTGLPQPVASAQYDVANELTQWGSNTISYDANGNIVNDGTAAYSWNARNQLAGRGGVSFLYDAYGRRILNAAGAELLYQGLDAVQELSGTTPVANRIVGGMDEVFARSDSSGTSSPVTDALGSTLGLLNSSGTLTTQYIYDPFGNTANAGSGSGNVFQYTSRENDGNGLYYYRARYYSSLLGRFISEDPLGFKGGMNRYAYAGDAPTMYTDPSGLNPKHPKHPANPCPDGQTPVQADFTHGVVAQAGATIGPWAPNVSYVPSTGQVYQTAFSVGYPFDIGVNGTVGVTTNPDLSGYGAGVSAFYGPGGGVSASLDGDVTVSVGFGTPGWGVNGGKTYPWFNIPPALATVCINAIPAQDAVPIGDGMYTEQDPWRY